MVDRGYLHAMAAAGIVTTTPAAKGIPVWRERGLAVADLLLGLYVDHVRRLIGTPRVVEHPFLMRADAYESVFGEYANVSATEVPGRDGRWVLRPDNLHLSAPTATDAPVVATGGLMRSLAGGATPLFRDRHIWPSVQTNQVVVRGDAPKLLDLYRQAVEATIRSAGLPVVTVDPSAPSPYGSGLLAVSCLPNGRPTVLATLYLLADRYRSRMGVTDAVIDIGFTGKVIAVAAMHHRDHRGLAPPSSLAPTQVGVVAGSSELVAALSGAGVRSRRVTVAERTAARWRAERRLHREATPLVVGLGTITTRLPLTRRPLAAGRLGAACRLVDEIIGELTAHDARLADRAERRFAAGGLLRYLCDDCARTTSPMLFGWRRPERLGGCADCRRVTGRLALLSDTARFY